MRILGKREAGVNLPRVELEGGLVGPVILVAGENEISADYWDAVKDNPAVVRWQRADWFEVIDEEDSTFPTLKGLNASEAIELVRDTDDPGLLSDWLQVETRVTVRSAIESQIEYLEES